MKNRLMSPGRLAAMAGIAVVLLAVYLYFLYQLQIIQGEAYYNRANELTQTTRTVTAARGNILDRYGRVLVSNAECYNLRIDTDKLFANEDPNSVILELVGMVRSYGDEYTDDLPITMEPPFEYDPNMTAIQRTMLEAYFVRQGLSPNSTAVELMSYMRTRYNIDNRYSANEMRLIAGVRYSINVRYAINTADYVFVEDASMNLISSIMENKLVGIEVKRAYIRQYATEYGAHILGYVGLMTQEEFEKYSLLEYSTDAMVGKDGIEYAFENYLHGTDGKVRETRNAAGTILATEYIKEPVPGNHIYLTIDMVLQEQTERILGNGVEILKKNIAQKRAEGTARGDYNVDLKDNITGASAVVVNVKTGEPLAMASWPTYDVSRIIEDYQMLLEAENAPLFNRALLGTYAPGSTFKPCTAIAGLTKGIINTEKKVKCQGVYTRYAAEGYAPECWIWNVNKKEHLTHPEENVTTAIRDSCNYFFYTVGNDLGVDDMGQFAAAFGLGQSGASATRCRPPSASPTPCSPRSRWPSTAPPSQTPARAIPPPSSRPSATTTTARSSTSASRASCPPSKPRSTTGTRCTRGCGWCSTTTSTRPTPTSGSPAPGAAPARPAPPRRARASRTTAFSCATGRTRTPRSRSSSWSRGAARAPTCSSSRGRSWTPISRSKATATPRTPK